MLKTDDCLCYTSKSITYTVYPEFLMSKGFSLAPLAIGSSEHFIKISSLILFTDFPSVMILPALMSILVAIFHMFQDFL